MAQHTIIYTTGGGRTCDQLLTLAQFVALCAEYPDEFKVVDIPFWPYGEGFAAFFENRLCGVSGEPHLSPRHFVLGQLERWTRSGNSGQSITRRIVRRFRAEWLRGYEAVVSRTHRSAVWIGDKRNDSYQHCPKARRREMLNLDDPEVLADFRSRSRTLICGPRIRCWPLVVKHHATVRRVLALRPGLVAPAAALVTRLRTSFDFLIAVHLRQTDYKAYHQGRFYFPTTQYVDWMRQAQALFADRGRVGFLVVSDQPQDPAAFAGLPIAFSTATQAGGGHYLEDLAVLGLCDLVLATASSFAFWGAFQGGLSVIPMTKPGQEVRLKDAVRHLWECPQHADLQVPIW